MSEKSYDDEIAPELLKLADRCRQLGMSFTATVEYAPGSRATTASGISDENMDMFVPYLAGRLGGKLDDLLLAIGRSVTKLKIPHSCICLERMGFHSDPNKR